MLIQGRLERMDINLMNLKLSLLDRVETNLIHFKWGSVWIFTFIKLKF